MLSALDAHFGTHALFDSAKLVVARDGNCAVWFRGDGVDLGTVDACTDTDSDDVDIWLTGTFAAGEGGDTGGDTRDVAVLAVSHNNDPGFGCWPPCEVTALEVVSDGLDSPSNIGTTGIKVGRL